MVETKSNLKVELEYESCIREAASYLMCNYSSLNMGFDMGFAARTEATPTHMDIN